mmetsp:Transcript_8937/g.27358  ORF Transcript_8937/g.27358 Transcript_8937/m.27358 type:complete len:84 (-) Transcript_8937:140-391(-)
MEPESNACVFNSLGPAELVKVLWENDLGDAGMYGCCHSAGSTVVNCYRGTAKEPIEINHVIEDVDGITTETASCPIIARLLFF